MIFYIGQEREGKIYPIVPPLAIMTICLDPVLCRLQSPEYTQANKVFGHGMMPAQATPFLGELIVSVFQASLSRKIRHVISPVTLGFDAVKNTVVPLFIFTVCDHGTETFVGSVILTFPARRVMDANPPEASTSKRTMLVVLTVFNELK